MVWSKFLPKPSKFSTLQSANSLGSIISTEDSDHCNISGLILFYCTLLYQGHSKRTCLSDSVTPKPPKPQSLFETSLPNMGPSETVEGSAFNLGSSIACLYFGNVKLNSYCGIVRTGGLHVWMEEETFLVLHILRFLVPGWETSGDFWGCSLRRVEFGT